MLAALASLWVAWIGTGGRHGPMSHLLTQSFLEPVKPSPPYEQNESKQDTMVENKALIGRYVDGIAMVDKQDGATRNDVWLDWPIDYGLRGPEPSQ